MTVKCLTEEDVQYKAYTTMDFFKTKAEELGYETISDYLYVRYCEDKLNMSDIAREVCLLHFRAMVKFFLEKMGIKIRGRHTSTLEERQKMVEMRKDGYTYTYIANKLGFAVSFVYVVCQKEIEGDDLNETKKVQTV